MENTMNTRERQMRAYEALQIALAKEDAKHMPDTAEMDRQVDMLFAAGRRKMAQIRYAENARWPVEVVSGEIRPEIVAMDRNHVLARLATLRTIYPAVQYAHREAEALSDHDLRAMLEDATRLTEDKV